MKQKAIGIDYILRVLLAHLTPDVTYVEEHILYLQVQGLSDCSFSISAIEVQRLIEVVIVLDLRK